MLHGISQFANQSYGLPIRINAYQTTVSWKPSEKVKLAVIPTKSVNTKQKP